MIDPDDLNVGSPADYMKFAKLADHEEQEFAKDRDLILECCGIESGLTEWEVEFIDGLAQRIRQQMAEDSRVGLLPSQRSRLEKILRRFE